jgi:hypothetical protein
VQWIIYRPTKSVVPAGIRTLCLEYVPVELAKQPVDLVNPPEKHTPKRMVFHSNGYKEADPKIPRTCSLPCWMSADLSSAGVLIEQDAREAMELAWDWIGPQVSASCSLGDGRVRRRLPCERIPATFSSVYFPQGRYGSYFYGSGHSSFAWKIRSYANVKTVFSSLYMKRQISFPLWMGLSCGGPDVNTADEDGSIWIKTRFSNLVKSVFRGLVNLMDSTPATGGNVW